MYQELNKQTYNHQKISSGFILHVYLLAQQWYSFHHWFQVLHGKTIQTSQQPSFSSSSSSANQASFYWDPLRCTHMVLYQLPMGLWDATNRRWGEIINKAIGNAGGRWRGKWWLLRRLSCFFLSHLHTMVEDRPLLCSEIDMQNESWWEVVWRLYPCFLKSL